jgi:XRE family transcriptional regulator, regulator of sulfur utilization
MLCPMKITRRIAAATAAAGLILVALAVTATRAEAPAPAVMHSGVFSWESLAAQPTKVGAVRRVFDNPTTTLNQLEVHITTLKPGEAPHGPHRHPDEELIIVKEGTIESNMDGVLRRLGPGSVLFQASNELHTVKNVGDTEATYHVIRWKSAATPPPKP